MRRVWQPIGLALAASVLVTWPATAQVKNWPSESVPRPLAARPVKFPPYEIRMLPSGLQVVVVQHHEQPAVSVRMLVRAGTAQDPPGKAGLANLVASLLDQGTATRSAAQIADTVDTIGGRMEAGAGTDLTFAYVTVMKDSLGLGLDLLSDVVRTPAFAGEELERQRAQLRSGLKVSYEDPGYIATVVFERLIYGFHPYGLPGNGTPESIDRISRDDLIRYHQQYYVPNNCILAVVGDVTIDEAMAGVERTFGGWARKEIPAAAIAEPPAPTRRVVIIDKPDAVQTELRAGHLSIPRKNPDYLAVDLAARILGGEGANRLQQVLRVQRGLTYGASSDLNAYKLGGDIVAETNTRTDATAEVLRVMVDEFYRLQRDSADERELEGAKAYLSGSFPLAIETPDAISTRVLNALFYGLPLEELQNFRERVNAIDVDDLRRVTRAYLKPDRLSIVLVGNAAAFASQLRGAGIKQFDVVRLAELDLSEPGLRRRPAPPVGTAAPVGVPPPSLPLSFSGMTLKDWTAAKAVVLRVAAASGGLAVLQSVKTVRATASTVLSTPDGPLRAETRTYVEYPARFRVDARVPKGEIVQAYADGAAWIKDALGPRDAPQPMKDEFAASVRRDWIALIVAASNDQLMGRRLADERGEGGRLLQVVELWAEGLARVRLAADAETGRLARLSYQTGGPAGRETTTETFGDFREVAGLQVPFRAVIWRDQTPVLERTIRAFDINVTFPPSFFQKPQ